MKLPMALREAEYALGGSEAGDGILERVLCVFGPRKDLTPAILMVVEGELEVLLRLMWLMQLTK